MQRLAVAVLGAAWVLCPDIVSAQPTSRGAERRELIDQGVQARRIGDHEHALDLFTRAGQIEMRPGLRMSLAEEYQALGQARPACETASRCVEEVQADLSRPESGRVLQGCAELVSATCARFGRLRMHLPTPSPAGLRVSVQGRSFDVTGVDGVAIVDPGDLVVQASDASGETYREQLAVRPGETREVSVALQRNTTPTIHSLPVPATSTPADTATVQPRPGPAPDTQSGRRGPGAGPWIVGGLGIAGLGTAAALWWGVRAAAQRDLDAACPASTMSCDPYARNAQERGQTAALGTNIALAAGAVGVVGGILWLILGARQEPSHPQTAWSVRVDPIMSGGLVRVTGTF